MSKRQGGGFTNFLMLACAALSVLVVLLAWQNFTLKKQLAGHGGPIDAGERYEVGEAFDTLTLIDDTGVAQPLEFGQGEGQTLLFVFTSTCPACVQTLPIWSELAETALGNPGVRVVGAQLDRGEETEADALVPEAYPFAIYGVERESEALRQVPVIPVTLLIDSRGTVTASWYGTLQEADVADLEGRL